MCRSGEKDKWIVANWAGCVKEVVYRPGEQLLDVSTVTTFAPSRELSAVDSCGGFLCVGDSEGFIYLLTVANSWRAHRSVIRGITCEKGVNQSGRFVTCSDDGVAKLWDGQSVASEYTGSGWSLLSCDWHPKDAVVLLGGKDNRVRIWDVRTPGEAVITEVCGHRNTVTCVRWNPFNDGLTFLSVSRDRTSRSWDARQLSTPVEVYACRRDFSRYGPFHLECAEWVSADRYVDAAHVFDAGTFDGGILAMSFDGESRRLLVVGVGCGAVCYDVGV